MKPFLEKFFPSILENATGAEKNVYCVYEGQILMAFTSSLYIAGLAVVRPQKHHGIRWLNFPCRCSYISMVRLRILLCSFWAHFARIWGWFYQLGSCYDLNIY